MMRGTKKVKKKETTQTDQQKRVEVGVKNTRYKHLGDPIHNDKNSGEWGQQDDTEPLELLT